MRKLKLQMSIVLDGVQRKIVGKTLIQQLILGTCFGSEFQKIYVTGVSGN